MQPKGADDAGLRQQIVDSVVKQGEPQVYSSIATCVERLARIDSERYSRWLVVLTDTGAAPLPRADRAVRVGTV